MNIITLCYQDKFLHDLTKIGFFYRTKAKEILEAVSLEMRDRLLEKEEGIIKITHQEDTSFGKIYLFSLKIDKRVASLILLDFREKDSDKIFYALSTVINQGLKNTIEESITDKIGSINHEVTEIKNTMVDNLEKILNKREKLDELLEKTQYISDQSKDYLRGAKKLNSCCIVL